MDFNRSTTEYETMRISEIKYNIFQDKRKDKKLSLRNKWVSCLY